MDNILLSKKKMRVRATKQWILTNSLLTPMQVSEKIGIRFLNQKNYPTSI